MRRLLIALGLFSPLIAKLPPSDLSADKASYDQEILTLTGNVTVDHSLGQLKGERAILHKHKHTFAFSTIELQSNVSFFSLEHGSLFAETAFFDLEKRAATLSANGYPVLYKGPTYQLTAKTIDLTLDQGYAIDTLAAEGDVFIENLDGFSIDCNKATSHQNTLTAFGPPCHCKHNLDAIDADSLTYNRATSLLSFVRPKGILSSPLFPNDPTKQCRFVAETLLWNQIEEVLTLEKNIQIDDPTFGTLIGKDLLTLKQKRVFDQKNLESITATGETTLISKENERLTNYGTMTLDQETLLLTCTNPPNCQLKYEKETLLLFADKAEAEYTFQGTKIAPHTLRFDGNVRILSHDLSRPLRKGLADHLIHNPHTQETRLIADEGNAVLFWDEEKKYALSAPEILINHQEEDLVKGIGTVRFFFTEEEGKRIEEFF
ncbi:MAG: hypothetical protein KDK63_04145 [Chlamydiia bacterium]|nr:hypothetical protein [Chlamydiia bacterium]